MRIGDNVQTNAQSNDIVRPVVQPSGEFVVVTGGTGLFGRKFYIDTTAPATMFGTTAITDSLMDDSGNLLA